MGWFEHVAQACPVDPSKAAHTGNIGDGTIFVSNFEQVIRIRTGETDETAL